MAFLEDNATDCEMYLLLRGFFPPQHVMRLLGLNTREMRELVEMHFEGLQYATGEQASSTGFNFLEFKRYLHDQLLRDTDVFSMAHSIEVRVPLLDHTIVEYAASLNPGLKARNGVNKPLLVGAVNDPLLRKAGKAKKQGFSFPMDRWMKHAAGDLEDLAVSDSFLDQSAVRELWKDFRGGRLHWSRAWALTVLEATGRDAPA